jgi:hypothetical protein
MTVKQYFLCDTSWTMIMKRSIHLFELKKTFYVKIIETYINVCKLEHKIKQQVFSVIRLLFGIVQDYYYNNILHSKGENTHTQSLSKKKENSVLSL